ncbi:m-AAA protease-interacting protein 1, mitochondrial [Brachionichthys hirsutus]|uniref:m-AAA protease-interacting protein 1, mitochondrial n=1 Tax=Brachionichthys hirsutus TaxID=412623 RepID=UPI00360501B3
MALPILRGCARVQRTFSFSRLFLSESSFRNRTGKTFGASLPPAAGTAPVRPYSSERGGQNQTHKVLTFGISNPLVWIRTRVYYFLIRAYFDNEFNIEEFTAGAKQAFIHVSGLLSQCEFHALEGLVSKDLIGELEAKCRSLPSSHKEALSVTADEIMYTTAEDVGIYHSDERKFVSIRMRFWYLTSADLPDDSPAGTHVFHVAIDEGAKSAKKRVLAANYEFQREFRKGLPPDWTITRIEHSKILE